jgi:hypothetical protein
LPELGVWIADDAANQQWGRPVDHIELADGQDDRVVLPETARLGDRLLVSFSPCGRVWADVVEQKAPADPEAKQSGRRRGVLGSILAEAMIPEAIEVQSAWTTATELRPIRLPGEVEGTESDPFASPVDEEAAAMLLDWAAAQGIDTGDLDPDSMTKASLFSARYRFKTVGELWASWPDFNDAVDAILNDDGPALEEALTALEAFLSEP